MKRLVLVIAILLLWSGVSDAALIKTMQDNKGNIGTYCVIIGRTESYVDNYTEIEIGVYKDKQAYLSNSKDHVFTTTGIIVTGTSLTTEQMQNKTLQIPGWEDSEIVE